MKVAVTSQGRDLDSLVDPRFGRTRWFIVVDTETGRFDVVDNEQNVNAVQGAGIQAARQVSQHGASVLLTGHCGPNAFRTLQAAGINVVVGVDGTVAGAIERFKRGELSPADRPDVDGHWSA